VNDSLNRPRGSNARRQGAGTIRHLLFVSALAGLGLLSGGVVPEAELREEAGKPVQIEVANDVATLEWFAHPEVFYFVEGSPDLTTWIPAKLLKDTVPEGSLMLATTVANPKAFYRIIFEGDPDSPRLRADSDGDGIINLLEAEAEWDAYVTEDPTDSDADGIPDYFEQFHFGDLTHDGNHVATTGGLTLAEAYANATDPNSADSDGDGFTDAYEIANNLDPNYNQSRDKPTLDTDGDGLSDAQEILYRTDPTVADSDGDGLEDGRDGWARDANLQVPRLPENYVLIDLSAELPLVQDTNPVPDTWILERIQIDDHGGILYATAAEIPGEAGGAVWTGSTTAKYHLWGETYEPAYFNKLVSGDWESGASSFTGLVYRASVWPTLTGSGVLYYDLDFEFWNGRFLSVPITHLNKKQNMAAGEQSAQTTIS